MISSVSPQASNGGAARLVLVRHGQTDWNLERRFQGQTDIALNELGYRQAQQAAERLQAFAASARQSDPDFSWQVIVSSPLLRARQTAEVIASQLGLSLAGIYPGMQERSFGQAEGMRVTAENRLKVEEFFEDVEPLEQLRSRGIAALNRVRQDFAGCHTIVVAHGMWISQVLTEVTGSEVAIPANADFLELAEATSKNLLVGR